MAQPPTTLHNVTLVCFSDPSTHSRKHSRKHHRSFRHQRVCSDYQQCLVLVCADHSVSVALSATRVDEVSLVQSDIPVLLTWFSAGRYSHSQVQYISQLLVFASIGINSAPARGIFRFTMALLASRSLPRAPTLGIPKRASKRSSQASCGLLLS